jgi:hypothetical protein
MREWVWMAASYTPKCGTSEFASRRAFYTYVEDHFSTFFNFFLTTGYLFSPALIWPDVRRRRGLREKKIFKMMIWLGRGAPRIRLCLARMKRSVAAIPNSKAFSRIAAGQVGKNWFLGNIPFNDNPIALQRGSVIKTISSRKATARK